MTQNTNTFPTDCRGGDPNGARFVRYLVAGVGCSMLATSPLDAAVIPISLVDAGVDGPNGGLPDGAAFIGLFPYVPGGPNPGSAMRVYNGASNRWGLAGSVTTSTVNRLLEISASGTSAAPTKFAAGATIDATSPLLWTTDGARTVFRNGTDLSPDFLPNEFMGFRFSADNGANWNYGYLEVIWNSTDSDFEILSAAYESNLNQSIGAGATPIPGAGGLMALMALGGGAFRRRGRAA